MPLFIPPVIFSNKPRNKFKNYLNCSHQLFGAFIKIGWLVASSIAKLITHINAIHIYVHSHIVAGRVIVFNNYAPYIYICIICTKRNGSSLYVFFSLEFCCFCEFVSFFCRLLSISLFCFLCICFSFLSSFFSSFLKMVWSFFACLLQSAVFSYLCDQTMEHVINTHWLR